MMSLLNRNPAFDQFFSPLLFGIDSGSGREGARFKVQGAGFRVREREMEA
jgi:hypothetical protein